MPPSRNEVIALVRAHFPAESWTRVIELLDTYGIESYEPERERVQVAILKLSSGSEGKLREYVASAKGDYRDVLYWAEYPEQSSLDTPERWQRMRELCEKLGVETVSDSVRDVPYRSENPAQATASVLEVLRARWSWALSGMNRVLAQNSFGNVLVALDDGSIWRVCPEDLEVSKVVESEGEFTQLWASPEFQTDWAVDAWVEAAESALGRLDKGQCYGFKIWPVLGGAYDVENMAIKSISEWLAVSGDVARQAKDLPPGTQIRLDVRDA